MESLRKIIGILIIGAFALSPIACGPAALDSSEVQGDRGRAAAEATVSAAAETAQGALILERIEYIKRITSTGFPANEFNCPMRADDPCSMVNILVEFPHPTAIGTVGHTGIAISRPDGDPDTDLYYDFGPGEELHPDQGYSWDLGLYRKYEGRPWWDHPKHYGSAKADPSEVGFKDILANLDSLAGDYTTMRIPICVAKEHAKRIIEYWEQELYSTPMPTYSVPGLHCTSTVARSFEHTHPDNRRNIPWVEDSRTLSPTRYPERILSPNLLSDYRHQCGAMKGEFSRAILLRKWSGLPD